MSIKADLLALMLESLPLKINAAAVEFWRVTIGRGDRIASVLRQSRVK